MNFKGFKLFENKKQDKEIRIFADNVPLGKIPCNVLKDEIARRKKENYERQVKEANAKADRVDKMIDELCKEMSDREVKTDTYEDVLAVKILNNIKYMSRDDFIQTHMTRNERERERDSNICSIKSIIYSVDQDAVHLSGIFEYMKAEYRKTLLRNIRPEC